MEHAVGQPMEPNQRTNCGQLRGCHREPQFCRAGDPERGGCPAEWRSSCRFRTPRCPDYAGHAAASPFVFPYLDAIEAMDVLIGQMIAAMEARPNYAEEDWLVPVTTDHGGIGTTHGGNSMEERRVSSSRPASRWRSRRWSGTLSPSSESQRTVLGMRPGFRSMAIPERRCRLIRISRPARGATSPWSVGCGRRRLRMSPWWATRIGVRD